VIRRWRKNTPGRWQRRRGGHEATDQVPLCWSLGFTCTAFNWTHLCSIPTFVWTQPFHKSGRVSVQVSDSKLHLLKQKRFKDFILHKKESLSVRMCCMSTICGKPFLLLFARLFCLQNLPARVRYMWRSGCENSWKPLINPDVAVPVPRVYFRNTRLALSTWDWYLVIRRRKDR
jgi:hypothetical protein